MLGEIEDMKINLTVYTILMWLPENVKLHTWLVFVTRFIFLLDSASWFSSTLPLLHPDPAGINYDLGQVI